MLKMLTGPLTNGTEKKGERERETTAERKMKGGREGEGHKHDRLLLLLQNQPEESSLPLSLLNSALTV